MFRTAALVLLLAAVALAQDNRISVGPTSITMRKDDSAVVTFRLSEPILCPPDLQSECAVVIELENQATDRIAIDNCHIKWTQQEWFKTRTLRITALENFVEDGTFTTKIITKTVKTEADFYKGVNPDDITVTAISRPSAHCSGTGDPHYTTFDGQYWHVYQAGRYVFYANPNGDFETQVATRAYPARHCAFVAKEGPDAFIVDACSGSIRYKRICGTQECASGGFPKIGVAGCGGSGTYSVTFKSGRHVYASVSPYYLNMYANAPGRDFQSGTHGICGNFDGNRGNDSPCGGCRVNDLNQLFANQRPTRDLFQYSYSGPLQAPSAPPPAHIDDCVGYQPPAFIPPILTQPDVEDITDLLTGINIDNGLGNGDGDEVIIDFNDAPEVIQDMTVEQATDICVATIGQSAAAAVCADLLGDLFNLTHYIGGCIDDLAESGDVRFVEDAVENLQIDCAADAERLSAQLGTENIEEIGSVTCPEDCNDRGSCADSICTCDEGFTGADCGIDRNAPPIATRLTTSQCDTQGDAPCATRTSVIGDNFFNNGQDTHCEFTITQSPDESEIDVGHVFQMDSFFLGATEQLCAIPPIAHRGGIPIVAEVRIVTKADNGNTVKSEPLTFTWFDGICQVCDASTHVCGPNPNSCTIDGECHREGVHEPQNTCLVCDPLQDPSNFVFSYTNHLECGPKFDALSFTAPVGEDLVADQEIVCVNAANPFVAEDATNKVTYTMTHGQTDTFKVDPDTGCILAARDITLESVTGLSNFNNLVGIQATDSAGNHDSTQVLVDFAAVNSNPLFDKAGYAFTIDENVAAGTEVGIVSANDANAADTLTYEFFSQPSDQEEDFAIDGATGRITVAGSIDFEDFPLYHLLVKVKDGAGQFHITNVTIAVNNVDEAPTDIALDNANVDENQIVGTVVGALTSVDPEGGSHTYAVSDADFAINGASLITNRVFDFENDDTNSIVVSITSTDNTGLSFTKDFTITINDVNEAPKDIALSATSFSEGVPVGQTVAQITFTDDDNTNDPNNQLVACGLITNSDGIFAVINNQLLLNKPLDFETAESHEITIGCADNGEPVGISQPATFTITVKNANDAPDDVQFETPVTVPEDLSVGSEIGVVVATDFDADSGDITFTVDSNQFSINGEPDCTKDVVTGATTCSISLIVNEPLDFESSNNGQIDVPITVTDDTGATRETVVTFTVTDVNEAPKGAVFVSGAEVQENTTPDVVSVIGADDEDQGQKFTFVLTNNNDKFELVQAETPSTTADLKLKAGQVLDHEATPTITLDITITDNGTPAKSTDAQLVLTITDEPLSVSFNTVGTKSITVSEDTTVPSTIGTLVLSGDDQPGVLTYSMELAANARRDNSLFEIQDNNLVLVESLDAESAQVVEVTVTAIARDASNQIVASVPTTLDVNVENVDEAPVFEEAQYTTKVNVDEQSGFFPTVTPRSIAAVDPENTAVTYSLDASNTAAVLAIFQINPNTGVISVGATPSSQGVAPGQQTVKVAATSNGKTTVADLVVIFEQASTDGSGTGASKSSNTGLVAGVVVAVLCLVLLACILAFVYLRKNNEDNRFKSDPEYGQARFDNPTFQAPGATYASVGEMSAAFVPGVSNPLYEWYQPEMTRQECTDHLMVAEPGTFVVRDSKATPGWHILGCKTEREVLHEKIRCTDDGHYQLLPTNAIQQQPRFGDIPALVSHYSAPQPGIPFTLDMSRFSNPMYAMSAGPGGYSGAALPNDPAAPMVPLKQREVGQVAQIANAAQDIYSNTEDARAALRGTSA
jgi:hypothetical protein